jgi:hypothetical protein
MLRTLKDLPDIKGLRVMVRGALNAPVENGRVTDPYRLEKTLPTVEFLLKKRRTRDSDEPLVDRDCVTLADVRVFENKNHGFICD